MLACVTRNMIATVIMRYVLFKLSPWVQCFVVFLLLCFLGQFRFEATFVWVAWHSEFLTVIRHYVTPRFVRDRVFVVHGTNCMLKTSKRTLQPKVAVVPYKRRYRYLTNCNLIYDVVISHKRIDRSYYRQIDKVHLLHSQVSGDLLRLQNNLHVDFGMTKRIKESSS